MKIVANRIHRRALLRGAGVALALPWLEVMASKKTLGSETAQAPSRFVTFFQPNGVYPKAWDVKGIGKDFSLSPILQGLAAYKDQMLVLSGLDSTGKGHVKLTGAFLTGKAIEKGVNGISLDQVLANQVRGSTRFASVELGTEPPRQGMAADDPIALANTVSWSSPTQRISPEISPTAAFDRLFRDPSSPEAIQAARERRSVLDLVMHDTQQLKKVASGRDRQKIEEYLDGIRSVERQIDRIVNPPPPQWTPTEPPTLARPPAGIPESKAEHMKLMLDLIVLALQTDTTRVATFMSAHGFSRQNFTFLDGVKNDHHGMSHHKNLPSLVAEYTKVSQWYAEQVNYLITKMQAIDEGGSSLLDNSLVVYGSEMKDGNGHISQDLPLVLLGKAKGALQGGQHLKCPKGTPLANLHLTIATHFGVDLPDFNQASTGTIPGIFA
jgi:hypothetical protein